MTEVPGHPGVKSVRREHKDGKLHTETTIEAPLPESVVTALAEHDLKLKFHNPEISAALLDQSAEMIDTDGCISSPGGPSC
jgi:hypothetical protein